MLRPVPASVKLPEDYQTPKEFSLVGEHTNKNANVQIPPHANLPTTTPSTTIFANDRYLITSPYTTPEHLLDLDSLTQSQRFLAVALTSLQCTRPDYSTAAYIDSFNWSTVITNLKNLTAEREHQWQHQHFYIVVFRSRVPPTTDRAELGKLDERSHAEANKSGGLLKYWFGVPDGEGRNLATCIWRYQEDARPGSVGPGHKAAARATRDLYTEWRIQRLKLVIENDVSGWEIEDWED